LGLGNRFKHENIKMSFPYFGEFCGLIAAILWSITVVLLRKSTYEITPFLINPIKNTIGFFLFLIFFQFFEIPFWYELNFSSDYMKILVSGALGMALGDTIFIYALSTIGANRVAIVDSFSPFVIYFYSLLMLHNQTLSIMQFVGFLITIFAIIMLTYEKDYDEIDFKVKTRGIFLVLFAMSCTGFGVVLLKTVLNEINNQNIKFNLWVTVFRLFPGVVISWLIFSLQSNKQQLLIPLKKYKNIKILILASVLGPFLALAFWILGYAYIDKPSVASIISQMSVVFISILSWYFLNEKVSKIKILSVITAFIGVTVTALAN
tara:strand:- start:1111 stop:2070 length:960 start_codon:yes stop_codon:yes gene_type:complete